MVEESVEQLKNENGSLKKQLVEANREYYIVDGCAEPISESEMRPYYHVIKKVVGYANAIKEFREIFY